jgi:hypothetical protein
MKFTRRKVLGAATLGALARPLAALAAPKHDAPKHAAPKHAAPKHAAHATAKPPAPKLADAFRGHGCFLYDPEETLAAFGGNPDALAEAVARSHMRHAWVRLHDVTEVVSAEPTQAIVAALRRRNILIAGYGWCHGRDPEWEARLGLAQMQAYGITHYVANIEQGKNKGRKYGVSKWDVSKIHRYGKAFRAGAWPATQLLISTYPFIGTHAPELMTAALPYVDGFAPQLYWFNYPSAWMWPRVDLPEGASYKVGDPASYVRLCLDMWRHYTSKPLVITGQAYWHDGETADFDRVDAETKFAAFLDRFNDYGRVAALNWWHLGGRSSERSGAMSPMMFAYLRDRNLDIKPYAAV